MLTRLLLLMLTCLPTAVAAAVTLDGIEFSTLPGDKIEIRMHFDGVPPTPTGYTIEQPARIALDLVGVKNGLDSKYHQLGSGNARSVTVIEVGERTRVIVGMTELSPYATRVDGDTLVLLVGQMEADEPASRMPQEQSSRPGLQRPVSSLATGSRIEAIDFRRGVDGEGRVIVNLSNTGIGVDVTSEGGKIRVEFTATQIPAELQRRLDVTDFATPVLVVDALPESNNTILMI